MSAGAVHEHPKRHGEARLGSVTLFVDPESRLQVFLPRDYQSSADGELDRVPFVVGVGSPGVSLHMERPELERLHALIGYALQQAEETR